MPVVMSSYENLENGLRGFGISTVDNGDTMDNRAGSSEPVPFREVVVDGGDTVFGVSWLLLAVRSLLT